MLTARYFLDSASILSLKGLRDGGQRGCNKRYPIAYKLGGLRISLVSNNGLDELRDLWLLTLNHRVGGSSPSQPTYVDISEGYIQTLDVVQTLEYWMYLPNLYIQYLIS